MVTDRYRLPELNAGRPMVHPPDANRQSRQLLIALALLLVVLVLVLLKNGDFWFGSSEITDSAAAASETVSASSPAAPTRILQAPIEQSAPAKVRHSTKAFTVPVSAKAIQQETSDSPPPVVATNRVALPPLDVEVVAGDKHSTVHPGSNAMVAEITGDANRGAALNSVAANVTAKASEHERLSPVSAPELRQTIDATYPTLTQHSRVQGSVVLEAIIATDGSVEGLNVLSGPSILSAAAQQAVRGWHFKPYLQNGQPVETKCRVTVNFSIRISDTSSKTS
jgi:TonB family protein